MAGRIPLISSFLCVALAASVPVAAKTSDQARQIEPTWVLQNFEPHTGDVLQMTESQLLIFHSGMTVKGLSRKVAHEDQRHTLHFSELGRVLYEEPGYTRTGDWYVRAGALCVRYDDEPAEETCSFQFFYGGCVLSYAVVEPTYRVPLNPRFWSAVQKPTETDFEWDDVAIETAELFNCRRNG
jgi:hypothetical protein